MTDTQLSNPTDSADPPSRSKQTNVHYWMQDAPQKNFGDYLSEWLLAHVLDRPKASHTTTFLVGSVIHDFVIETWRSKTAPISTPTLAFWGCGLREPLRPRRENLQSCHFFGARGPLTRSILGLADSEPIGDPGLILRAFYVPAAAHETAGKALCIPHICDPKPYAQQLEETGCDVVLSPRIDGRLEALERLINQIASASLVLAGSLHAAIVACVYGVPFAFYNSGHIDCPFKWIDFAASVGMDAQFVQSVAQYRECIEPSGQRPVLPPVAPLLQRAPFTLRAGCLEKAEAVDRLVTE